MNDELDKLKRQFIGCLHKDFINLSLRRCRVYKHSSDKNGERLAFRNCRRDLLHELGNQYRGKVWEKTSKEKKEEKHYQNIEKLSNVLSEKHGKILRDGRFRIGIAQMSLNDYLKYLWCKNEIPIPPHCPVNSTILQKVRIRDAWTKCDRIGEYKHWIERLKEEAEKEELAEWELNAWLKDWG